MKALNSKKIIIIGILLGILFSLITYQNFEENIEEIIEAQEVKSNKLIDSNIEIIFVKIDTLVKTTVEASLDKVFLNAIEKNDIKIVDDYSSKISRLIKSHYSVSSIDFIRETQDMGENTEKKFDACFDIKNESSIYKIIYPVINNGVHEGSFEIVLDTLEILESMKKYINADVALFVKQDSILNKTSLAKKVLFEDYVVTHHTNSKLIEQITKDEEFELEDSENIFDVNGKLIEIDSVSLLSKNNDKVLVIFHDVTNIYKNIEITINDFIIDFIIVLLIFLLISYYIYYNSNKTITKQYDQIVEKKEESEKLLKVKSEFLANMSHEIRTPLNAINGFIDLIEEETKDKKILKYIHTVQNSSKGLLHIIEDILDLSKIESGKMSINKINFDTKSEFETIAYLFNTKLSSKKISLNLNIAKDLPYYLNSDSLRLKQVISNLIDNAIKFTSEGKSITVDISYTQNNLNVSVQDQGIGIEKDRQEKIFRPFTQADNSTTRKYGGTGLGLTISSQLIELLGGKLELESEIDKGSRFYFSIPVSLGSKTIIEKNQDVALDSENKKILLVEDNKSNQLFMKVILKKLQIDYDIANDGIEAVEYFSNNKYDVILMDENMPNMSGTEATKKIIDLEGEKNISHTPIIALTANALSGDREKFLAIGMDDYLSKPITKEKLAEVLSLYLDKT